MTITADGTPPAFGEEGYDHFTDLWSRLARPFEVVPTVAAVLGLPPKVVAQLVGMAVATSDEAERLLEEFPHTVRGLATSIHTHAERCIGSLRGPVLWSETMSARASSFGDPDLFVCSAPSRAYDIDENQVLAFALTELRDAARRAEEAAGDRVLDDPYLRHVRRNGNEAARYAEHPSLRNVSRRRPTSRAIKRTRSGKHKKTYEPALAMLDRSWHPLAPEDVEAWCDDRTRAQHRVLMELVNRLEASGGRRLPEFRAEKGALYSGPVQYYHARALGDRSRPSGIVIGQLLVDVPDRLHDPSRRRAEALLAARARGRRTMVIFEDADLDVAVERAIELATGPAPSA